MNPFHIKISITAFVDGIGTPTCIYATFGGNLYLNETCRVAVKTIFACHNSENTGCARLDHAMIQMGTIQQGQST